MQGEEKFPKSLACLPRLMVVLFPEMKIPGKWSALAGKVLEKFRYLSNIQDDETLFMKFCMCFSGIKEGSGLLEVRKDKDWEDRGFLQWRGHQLTCKTVAWCKGEARLWWLWEKTRRGWSSVSQCVGLSPTVWNFVPKLSSLVLSIPHSTPPSLHFAPLNYP